jgi:hypothetical protein
VAGIPLRRRTRIAAAVLAALCITVGIPCGFILDGGDRWLMLVSSVVCAAVMIYAAAVGESPAVFEDPLWLAKRLARRRQGGV